MWNNREYTILTFCNKVCANMVYTTARVCHQAVMASSACAPPPPEAPTPRVPPSQSPGSDAVCGSAKAEAERQRYTNLKSFRIVPGIRAAKLCCMHLGFML